MMKGFVYDNAEALAMAVRLRMVRKCPRDIDDLLGRVVMDLVYMAARLMAHKPKYSSENRIRIIFDMDNRMDAVMRIMRAIDSCRINTSDPKAMVNYMVNTAQNSLRNSVYFAENRQRICGMVNVDRIDSPEKFSGDEIMAALTGKVADIYGELVSARNGHRISTRTA